MPIKADSERLENKNFRNFAGKPLFQHMLDRLTESTLIHEIIINTDSDEVANYISKLHTKKVLYLKRPDFLKGHDINMNQLIEYDITKTNSEYFFQTHCTNPLLTCESINNSIQFYFDNLDKYDSIFSVDKIQKRCYTSDFKPINHKLNELVKTQDLPPIFVENSNFFIFSRTSFLKNHTRVGENPYMFPVGQLESIDIDYESEFLLAEMVLKVLKPN